MYLVRQIFRHVLSLEADITYKNVETVGTAENVTLIYQF